MKVHEVQALLLALPDDADLVLLPHPGVEQVSGLDVLHLAGAVKKDGGIYVIPIRGVHPVYRGTLSPEPTDIGL